MSVLTANLVVRSTDRESPHTLPMTGEHLVYVTTYNRTIGSGTMYGITEFVDVSDPPRKYRVLNHSGRGYFRDDNQIGGSGHGNQSWVNVHSAVRYNTVGTKTDQLTTIDRQLLAGGGGTTGVVDRDTLEGYEPSSPASFKTPYLHVWTKGKTRKYVDSFSSFPGELAQVKYWGTTEIDLTPGWTGNDSAQLYVYNPVWDTDHWEVPYFVSGSFLGPSGSQQYYLDYAIASGDQEPSAYSRVWTSSLIIGSGNAGSQSGTVNVPPNSSLRFRFTSLAGSTAYAPTSEVEWAAAGIRSYIYLAETEGEQEANVFYDEILSLEDTMEDALNRGSPTFDNVGIAETSVLTGGITAESHAPITFTAKVVDTQITFPVDPSRMYDLTITFTDTDLNTLAESETQEMFEFESGAVETEHIFQFLMKAPVGFSRVITSLEYVDVGPVPTPDVEYNGYAVAWYGRVIAAGGTVEVDSLQIASDFMDVLEAKSYFSKIRVVWPGLGANILAWQQHLYHGLTFIPTLTNFNSNFVDADFDQALGIMGNTGVVEASIKIFISNINARNINSDGNGNGGIGVFVITEPLAGGNGWDPIGFYGNPTSSLYRLSMRYNAGSPNPLQFHWGTTTFGVVDPSTIVYPSMGYGQRSSATSRRLYNNGVFEAENTSSHGVPDYDDYPFGVVGRNQQPLSPKYDGYTGRVGSVVMTNGQLTDPEILDLYTTFLTYLEQATGRI